jgi:hypothetical protein
VAAAADGTAAIATEQARLVVRQPGGDFGDPIVLGRTESPPDVAAAPGGWVLVVWRESERQATSTRAAIVAPDGSVRRALLDRARLAGGRYVVVSAPRAGIDAAGNAIAAWTRSEGGPLRLRSARSAGGIAWQPAGDEPMPGVEESTYADLAVSPAGRTLLTWVGEDGVRASLDGGAAVTVAAATAAENPDAALADDGSAVIAFVDDRERVIVVDRSATGAWSAPHRISGDEGDIAIETRDAGGEAKQRRASPEVRGRRLRRSRPSPARLCGRR